MDQPNSQFFVNLISYSFVALGCSLFFSYPNWFPPLWLSINHFLCTSLPYIWPFFFNPKCLFLVGNAIIIFLIGEWKLLGSQSPAAEIYDGIVERSGGFRRVSTPQETKREMGEEFKEVLNKVEDDQVEVEDGEEEDGLPADELYKRVEEFIARINKQRWVEAKSLV